MRRTLALLAAMLLVMGPATFPIAAQAQPYSQTFSAYEDGDDLVALGAFEPGAGVRATARPDPRDAGNLCAYLEPVSQDRVGYAVLQPDSAYSGRVTVEFRARVDDTHYRHMPNLHTSTGTELLVGQVSEGMLYINGGRARLETGRWMHYRYELDIEAARFALYLDGAAGPALIGDLPVGGDVADITFGIWDGEAATPMYIDDVAIYETPDDSRPAAFEETFGQPSGTALAELGWEVSGVPHNGAQVVCADGLDMARLSVEQGTGSVSLDLSGRGFSGPFTVELRAKLATMGYAQLAIRGTDASGAQAVLSQLAFTPNQNDLQILDVLNNHAWVGNYLADDNPDMPDFSRGWNTLRIYVDPMEQTATVALDGRARQYVGTLHAPGGAALQSITLMAQPGSAPHSDVYVDWLRVMPGQAIMPAPQAAEVAFSQDFEDVQPEASLAGTIFVADNNVRVQAADDPLGSGSTCAKLSLAVHSDNENEQAHAGIPLGNVFEGRISLSFRALVYDDNYRHMPCLTTSGNRELLAVATLENGLYGTGEGSAPLPAGQWNTLCYELDTEANSYALYINGSDTPAYTGTLSGAGQDVARLMFGLWNGRRDSAIYIDDITVHKHDGYTQAEKDAQLAAGRLMIETINGALYTGKSGCILPRGAYRLTSDCALVLDSVTDFTLDGSGSELWFASRMNGVTLRDCTNVTVRGFKADYDPLPFSQGTITALDASAKTFDLRIDDGYRIPDASWGNMRAIFYNADGTQEIPATYNDSAAVSGSLDGRTVRMQLASGDIFKYNLGVQPGDRFVCLGSGSGVGIVMENGNGNTIEAFDLYSAWQFGVSESGGEGGNAYRNFRFTRRPGTDRLMAGNSDGLHSARTKHGPTLEDCEISHVGDDLVNTHGFLDYVYRKVSDNVVDVVASFGLDFEAGTPLGFYDLKSWDLQGEATVVSVSQITDEAVQEDAAAFPQQIADVYGLSVRDITGCEVWRVTLDRAVDVGRYDIVESELRTGRGAAFRDSYFHDGHVRGILLRSPDAVVENCTFENINGPAVYIAPERFWAEGPFSSNMRVTGNTMRRTAVCIDAKLATPGAVTVFATPTENCDVLKNNYNMRDIVIENNVILHSGASGIFMANTDGAAIRGNHIDGVYGGQQSSADGQQWQLPRPWYGIYIAGSVNVSVEGNTFANLPAFAGEVYHPAQGALWEAAESLDGFDSRWQLTGMDAALSAMEQQGSDAGGQCLALTSLLAGRTSMAHSFAAPLTGKFAVSFAARPGAGSVRLPVLYDSDGNNVFMLDFTSNGLYVNGAAVGANDYDKWHVFTIYLDTDTDTWELYCEAGKLAGGTFMADSVSSIAFVSERMGTTLLDNIAVYRTGGGVAASAVWDAAGVTVTVDNQSGQPLDVYAVVRSGEVLDDLEKQTVAAGYSGRIHFALPAADEILLWRGMEPMLPPIVK